MQCSFAKNVGQPILVNYPTVSPVIKHLFHRLLSLFCLSPLAAIALCITGIAFLFKPKRRLIGLGILGAMIFLAIILTLGSFWIPWYGLG
ncbi:MAG: hypothetical protein NVS4B11_29130 [Ktedonobacteraceae bacterium]